MPQWARRSAAEPEREPAPAPAMAAGPPGTLPLLLLLLLPLLGLRGRGQGFGQTRFICTSVPLDGDMCAATAPGSGSAEELKSTVLQLRETVLQQKETIMNQKETIRELTAKLGRCESQSVLEPGEPKGGGAGRKGGFSKNTMGDLSRSPAAETLSQLGQTLQSLKTRLENLEVRAPPARRPRGSRPGSRRAVTWSGAERGSVAGGRDANSPLLCSPLAAVQQDELLQPDQQLEGHPAEQNRRPGAAGAVSGEQPGGGQVQPQERVRGARQDREHPHVAAPAHKRPGERYRPLPSPAARGTLAAPEPPSAPPTTVRAPLCSAPPRTVRGPSAAGRDAEPLRAALPSPACFPPSQPSLSPSCSWTVPAVGAGDAAGTAGD